MENIGGSTLNKLYDAGIETIIDLFDKSKFNQEKLIESGQFKKGRALDIIFESFEKRAPITMVTLIASLSFKATGWSTSKQVAKLYENQTPDWYGINYAAYSPFLNPNSEESKTVQQFIDTINQNGYTIEKQQQTQITADTITFEMTGSPKEFGFKTKDEFIKTVSAKGFVHTPLQKGTKYLITDDLQSDSSKTSKAKKLGIEIITYTQALNM